MKFITIHLKKKKESWTMTPMDQFFPWICLFKIYKVHQWIWIIQNKMLLPLIGIADVQDIQFLCKNEEYIQHA